MQPQRSLLLDLLGVSMQPQRSRWLVVAAGGICPLYSTCTLILSSLEHCCVGSSDCGGVLEYIEPMYRGPSRGPCIGSIYTHPSRVWSNTSHYSLLFSLTQVKPMHLNLIHSRSYAWTNRTELNILSQLKPQVLNMNQLKNMKSAVAGMVAEIVQ